MHLASPLRLPQHANQHRPERPVLLAVDQELGEGPALRVAPELSYPVGSLEVGEHEDVEQPASCRRWQNLYTLAERVLHPSKVTEEALNASATGEASTLWRELIGHVRDVVDGVDLVAWKTEDAQHVVVIRVNPVQGREDVFDWNLRRRRVLCDEFCERQGTVESGWASARRRFCSGGTYHSRNR
jgi:hypothetical protein